MKALRAIRAVGEFLLLILLLNPVTFAVTMFVGDLIDRALFKKYTGKVISMEYIGGRCWLTIVQKDGSEARFVPNKKDLPVQVGTYIVNWN